MQTSFSLAEAEALPESLDPAVSLPRKPRGNPRFAPTLPLHLNFLRPRPRDLTLARPTAPGDQAGRPGLLPVLAYFLTTEASDGPAPNLPPALRRHQALLGPAKVLFWLAVTVASGLGLAQLR